MVDNLLGFYVLYLTAVCNQLYFTHMCTTINHVCSVLSSALSHAGSIRYLIDVIIQQLMVTVTHLEPHINHT